MKKITFTFLLSVLLFTVTAQNKAIKYNDIRINGLLLNSSKSSIIKQFGNPQKVYEPHYECGFLSGEEEGRKVYCLQYPALLFTGNDKEKYWLEHIYFNKGRSFQVTYQGNPLSALTTIKAFETIFKARVVNNEIYLYVPGTDDKLIVTFKKGLLFEIEYWSPC